MRRLKFADIAAIRSVRGRTALLFITDRCPVGCVHCSVDSRPDSPRITDFALFREIIAGIAGIESIETVGISGGEPFTERRGLPLAVSEFRAANKDVVIYTSGYWGAGTRCPAWIPGVLRQTSTVIISTDSFHRETVAKDRFARAVEVSAEAGCHIIAQVLDEAENVPFVQEVMARVFGESWHSRSEINRITPLRSGRGRDVFQIGRAYSAHQLAPCTLTASPTIRYDGVISGCCNETVLMGGGPGALRARAANADQVRAALQHFLDDPMLQVIGTAPPGALTVLPQLEHLAAGRYQDTCGFCWRAYDAVSESPRIGRLLSAVGAIATQQEVAG